MGRRRRSAPCAKRPTWPIEHGARLVVVTAYEPHGDDLVDDGRRAGRAQVDAHRPRAGRGAGPPGQGRSPRRPEPTSVTVQAIAGSPADVLLEAAADFGADCIVVGSRRAHLGGPLRPRQRRQLGGPPRPVRRAHRPHHRLKEPRTVPDQKRPVDRLLDVVRLRPAGARDEPRRGHPAAGREGPPAGQHGPHVRPVRGQGRHRGGPQAGRAGLWAGRGAGRTGARRRSAPADAVAGRRWPTPRRPPTGTPPRHPRAPTRCPTPASLGITDYDALSASQVVPRLDGPRRPTELDAVRRYEAANRGRKTILSKIAQLQG